MVLQPSSLKKQKKSIDIFIDSGKKRLRSFPVTECKCTVKKRKAFGQRLVYITLATGEAFYPSHTLRSKQSYTMLRRLSQFPTRFYTTNLNFLRGCTRRHGGPSARQSSRPRMNRHSLCTCAMNSLKHNTVYWPYELDLRKWPITATNDNTYAIARDRQIVCASAL